jgi:D-hexose-6-phosphate mutarotase
MKRAELAVEPGDDCAPPVAVARPTVTRRIWRWSFEVSEPRSATAKTDRRKHLAEHVFSMIGGEILASQPAGKSTRVFVVSRRPVSEAAAEGVAVEWPWYVRGSFVSDLRSI